MSACIVKVTVVWPILTKANHSKKPKLSTHCKRDIQPTICGFRKRERRERRERKREREIVFLFRHIVLKFVTHVTFHDPSHIWISFLFILIFFILSTLFYSQNEKWQYCHILKLYILKEWSHMYYTTIQIKQWSVLWCLLTKIKSWNQDIYDRGWIREQEWQ